MSPRVTLGVIAATALAFFATFLPDAEDSARRPIPDPSLMLVRGGDPENPTASVLGCESANTNGGALSPDCTAKGSQLLCVICPDDSAVTATTAPGASGPGFSLVGMTSCGGEKLTGTCSIDPASGRTICKTQAWDGTSYCSGEINQAVFQVSNPG